MFQIVAIKRLIVTTYHAKYHGQSMIFHIKSYSDRRNRGRNGCQSFLVKVIFLLASRLLASTTLIYLCVVVILLCAMMLCMVRMSVPAAACSVANVLRPWWKVIGYARKSRQKKIKRKPFEMSIVSVFCQIEKMQMTT